MIIFYLILKWSNLNKLWFIVIIALGERFILISSSLDTRTSSGLAGLPDLCPFTPRAQWYRTGGRVRQGISTAGLGPHQQDGPQVRNYNNTNTGSFNCLLKKHSRIWNASLPTTELMIFIVHLSLSPIYCCIFCIFLTILNTIFISLEHFYQLIPCNIII